MTLLSDYYAELGDLTLSEYDTSTGIRYVLSKVEGWGTPGVTLGSVKRPGAHGGWSGESWLRPRAIALSGYVVADDPTTLSAAMDTLISACSLSSTTLRVHEMGRARSVTVRCSDEVIGTLISPTTWQWSAQFIADDPRKYAALDPVSTNLPSSSGGLQWPETWPEVWTGTTVTGIASLYNEGNISAPLVVRFDGPVTGPKVVHIQTGKVWAAEGAVISSGEFWTVDMDRRQVLAQGQASRSGYVTTRGWLELLPGQNDYLFSADAYDAASQMTVTAASAWK